MRNNTQSSTRLLCLHSWLDNCASFLPMMPHLGDVDCVAVDMAGHGRSAHRDRGSLYHYIDYVRDIGLIMDALEWEQCHLLGHSMGGSLSLMACNAYPNRVLSLTMIDSLHPLSREPEDGPALLRRSMQQFTQWNPSRKRSFQDLEGAIAARLTASPYPQTSASARLIMEYATEKSANGYQLRSDARLSFRSPVMLSHGQIIAFIQAVHTPTLAILAREGIMRHRSDIAQTLSLFQNIRAEYLSGNHHLHMDQPREVASLCLDFLTQHQRV